MIHEGSRIAGVYKVDISMKNELLKVNNLTAKDGRGSSLERISFYAFEGECIGFLGLSNSGKDFLMQILRGDAEQDLPPSLIFIDQKPVKNIADLVSRIYHLRPENFGIGDWTVAEYISLQHGGWLQSLKQRNEQIRRSEDAMQFLGLSFNVQRRLSDLNELEKRLTDLVKAQLSGARILLLEDECEGMTPSEVILYAEKLRETVKTFHCCALISCNTYTVIRELSDRFLIFRNGRIVKKCTRDFITNREQLGLFLLGKTLGGRKKSLDRYTQEQVLAHTEHEPVCYRVKNYRLKTGRHADLIFHESRITVLLSQDVKEKERLFMNLSGRRTDSCDPWLDNRPMLRPDDPLEFNRRRIVSIMDLRSERETFGYMSVGENLLLPSLMKLTATDYALHRNHLTQLSNSNPEILRTDLSAKAEYLDNNERIALLMERWYLFHPRALVLYEPFAQCDMYGIAIVKSYLRKFTARGTAVIIVKAREEDVEDIADEIISME